MAMSFRPVGLHINCAAEAFQCGRGLIQAEMSCCAIKVQLRNIGAQRNRPIKSFDRLGIPAKAKQRAPKVALDSGILWIYCDGSCKKIRSLLHSSRIRGYRSE